MQATKGIRQLDQPNLKSEAQREGSDNLRLRDSWLAVFNLGNRPLKCCKKLAEGRVHLRKILEVRIQVGWNLAHAACLVYQERLNVSDVQSAELNQHVLFKLFLCRLLWLSSYFRVACWIELGRLTSVGDQFLLLLETARYLSVWVRTL